MANDLKPPSDGPRVNEFIRTPKVRVIDEQGEMLGILSIHEALERAYAVELDLVEISPMADPPVCKILDYGKYKYELQKKKAESKKKQKVVETKEIKMRPVIDTNDYNVKLRSVARFLEEGNKVKITIRFRGREMSHQELGMNLLERVKGDTQDIAKVEVPPKAEGRQLIMLLGPKG